MLGAEGGSVGDPKAEHVAPSCRRSSFDAAGRGPAAVRRAAYREIAAMPVTKQAACRIKARLVACTTTGGCPAPLQL